MAEEPPAQVTTDLPFSLVPEWVLQVDVSDRAIRLYAVLGRYADGDGESFPSRRTLSEWLRCSLDSIDRATKELIDAGALTVEHRLDAKGDPTSNLYILHRVAAQQRPPRTAAATGSRTGAAQNENHLEVQSELAVIDSSLTAKEPRGVPRARGWKVDRLPVSENEEMLARSILGAWNAQTGQTLRSKDWLAKIIMRIREHPDLGHLEHSHIIARTLQEPWWEGDPSPSIIYGNGALFERCITAARNGHTPKREPRRFGRGVTSSELGRLEHELRASGR